MQKNACQDESPWQCTLTEITLLPSLEIQEARRKCPPWYVAFARTVHQVLSLVEADRPVLSPNKDAGDYFFFFFSPDRSIVHLFLGFLLLFRGHRLFDFDQVFRCRRITNPLSVVFNTNDSCSNRSGKNEASDANQQPRGGSRARFETGRSFGEMNCGNSWLAPRIIFDLCSRWFSLFLVGTIYRWTGNFNEDLSKPRWDEHRCKCYNVQF